VEPGVNPLLAVSRDLARAASERRGTQVGIAVRQGLFAVTETRGRATVRLSEWGSYADAVEFLRTL
jgi:hypothetical protein